MTWLRRQYPLTTEQTVNILGEFGPLMALFIVNALYGINAGTWALMGSTVLSMIVMMVVIGRLPVFPLIAGAVTLCFGTLTLITGDPMWVQLKVTIFNVLFAGFLWFGLLLRKNFFQYVFGKTFHFTLKGWDKLANNFAWFFLFTAVVNEVVRLSFDVQTWILFKVFFIMPVSGVFAWWQTRLMQPYQIDAEKAARTASGSVPTRQAGGRSQYATIKSTVPRSPPH